MALDTRVARSNVIHPSRIEDVAACRMRDMFAAGAVAAFADDVPLRYLLGWNVIGDGMTAIAGWACRSPHVVRRIEDCPPVGTCIRDVILEPLLVADVPLHGERIVVIADLGEVPLLPEAAVDQSYLIPCELRDIIRAEIGDDRIRVLSRIADHVCHRRLLPVLVDVRVALLARLRTGVMG